MEAEWIAKGRSEELQRALAAPGFSEGQRAALLRLDKIWVLKTQTLKTRIGKAKAMLVFSSFLKKPFEDATRDDVQRFLLGYQETHAPATVRRMKGILKSFYRDLLAPNAQKPPRIVAWIKLGSMRSVRKLPTQLLTTTEIKALILAATHPRDRAIVNLLYESAARASELLSLRIGDVEFDQYGARLLLRGKTGMRKVRIINSVPYLQEWLNHHPRPQDPVGALWIGWQHARFGEPLLYSGLSTVLIGLKRIAKLEKRVHPHLFRHSRLTELAKILTPAELSVFAGWTPGTDMVATYVHLSGEDVDRKILERAGIIPKEEIQKADALRPRTCPRCTTSNAATNRLCIKCTFLLEETVLKDVAKERDKLADSVPMLLKVLEDPEVAALFARKLNQIQASEPKRELAVSISKPADAEPRPARLPEVRPRDDTHLREGPAR